MRNFLNKNLLIFLAVATLASMSFMTASAAIKPQKEKDKKDEIQRSYPYGVYDLQQNTVSNIQFYTTNYGIFGLNVRAGDGGGYWPRGSRNQYIFGGGIWFGAIKKRPDLGIDKKYVMVTYNPNNGRSWLVPGRIDDGDDVVSTETKKYRTYFSTDFNKSDGAPINKAEGNNWPIWDASENPSDTLQKDRYFGYYIQNDGDRNVTKYPKGPAFISGEDIFATFKDTDLSRYDKGASIARQEGYPLRIQVEQTIYSWGFGAYRDFIFVKYNLINFSKDTLRNCWLAPVMDVDLGLAPNTQAGAANDRVRFFNEEDSLNLAVQWTNVDRGERGAGFGYLGFDFLESPAVIDSVDTTGGGSRRVITDSSGFLRRDKRVYTNDEQLGLVTFRNWPINQDIPEDEGRYDYMAMGIKDGDNGPGDKRFLMSTGPFNMRPGDTSRVIVGLIMANSLLKEADGSTGDMGGLIEKDKFAQLVYDNNFRAPRPPDRSLLTAKGMNNAVIVEWDETAEWSTDKYERGLDFMGFKLYRARRLNLDTFDINVMEPSNQYPSGKGPYGWREIDNFIIPTAFQKSVHRAGTNPDDLNMPFIDSLRIIGPYTDVTGRILDSSAVRVMRICRGCILYPDYMVYPQIKAADPILAFIDTGAVHQPWGPLYKSLMTPAEQANPIRWNSNYHSYLMDSVLVGVIKFNDALVKFNPIFYKKVALNITDAEFKALPTDGIVYKKVDTITTTTVERAYFMNTLRDMGSSKVIDVMVPITGPLMTDTLQTAMALDSIYKFIQTQRVADYQFFDFEGSDKAKNAIIPFVARYTQSRTFNDIGDDNRNGVIDTDLDPTKTEKVFNNLEYYYKILAFDEGDFLQPTPSKLNDASLGLPNLSVAYPKATRPSESSRIDVIYVDSAKIGGLSNFQFFNFDNDRLLQLFAGDTLELEMNPWWSQSEIQVPDPENPGQNVDKKWGNYRTRLTLTNKSDNNRVLYDAVYSYEVQPCMAYYADMFTEDTYSRFLQDTVIYDPYTLDSLTFNQRNNTEIHPRSGTFSTGDFKTPGYCYGMTMLAPAYGTLGFSFDYTLQQWGGMLRPGAIRRINTDAVTPVIALDRKEKPGEGFNGKDIIMRTQPVGTRNSGAADINRIYNPSEVFGSFNNGPAIYEVKFVEGGTDRVSFKYGNQDPSKATKTVTDNFNYLTLEIRNKINYTRPSETGGEYTVSYPGILSLIQIDTVAPANLLGGETLSAMHRPNPVSLFRLGRDPNEFINHYTLSANAWVNARNGLSVLKPLDNAGWPDYANNTQYFNTASIGSQGKYYLSKQTVDNEGATVQVDFVHTLTLSGIQYIFDYANTGFRMSRTKEWTPVPAAQYTYGPDFEAGDILEFDILGGALGLPLPGAKVQAVVRDTRVEDNGAVAGYTDSDLDQINIVPNPYYISHIGVKSPYDSKIYFTSLPKVCTIEIYTVTGDLVQTLNHDEMSSVDERSESVEIWNLLTSNNQRVQSQTFIALIKTPNGAETVKKFSVVVGSFRIIDEK